MEIAEIKRQLTIDQVLGHYGLKPDRNNMLCCPFHADKTPSLQVYPKTNTYCCFSANCTAGTGDAIQFIQLKENCNKHEALTKAASLVNGNPPVPTEAKLTIETAPLEKIAVLAKAFKGFAKALPLTKKAVEYMQGRGLDYKLCEVGCVGSSWHHELAKEFKDSLAKLGLLKSLPANTSV